MPRSTTERKTIASYTRMPSSHDGNPRYRITFSDGTDAALAPNVAVAYEIGNPDMREGCAVDVTYNGRGTIDYMRAVS